MTDSKDMTPKKDNTELTEKERLLLDAVANGAVSKADKLLSRGEVSPDCRDNEGRTPLMRAAEDGNAALVAVLIRHGADVNSLDADGETALMKAAFGGHLSVVELLAENGADLEIRNNDGSTALEIAQVMEHEDVAAFLSAQSADSMNPMREEISEDPGIDGLTPPGQTGSVNAASVAAAMAPLPEPGSYVQELDSELLPEIAESPYFKAQQDHETEEDEVEEATEEQEQNNSTGSDEESNPGVPKQKPTVSQNGCEGKDLSCHLRDHGT